MSAQDSQITSNAIGNLSVSFFSKVDLGVDVPDIVFSIPANTTPQGLAALINEVLSLTDGPQPFDFLIDDEFVCVPVDKFLRRRGISAEGVIRVEFMPAMRAQEGSKLPHDDWVASVAVPIAGRAQQCF